jgi:tripartite-type tricarboxylate transporter receptor subunit TctC
MMVTPGTSHERVRILRKAFQKTLKDPEALADTKESRMDVEPTSGEEPEALVQETFDSPPEVLERVRKVFAIGRL